MALSLFISLLNRGFAYETSHTEIVSSNQGLHKSKVYRKATDPETSLFSTHYFVGYFILPGDVKQRGGSLGHDIHSLPLSFCKIPLEIMAMLEMLRCGNSTNMQYFHT